MKYFLTLLFLISSSAYSGEFSLPKLPFDVSCWDKNLSNKNIELCNQYIFIDVDFDGVKEVVKRNFRSGQRFRDTFTIYKHNGLEQEGEQLKAMNYPPFNLVDSGTVFNTNNKTVTLDSSGGACSSEINAYKKIDTHWLIFMKEVFELDKHGKCYKTSYELNKKLELVPVNKAYLEK